MYLHTLVRLTRCFGTYNTLERTRLLTATCITFVNNQEKHADLSKKALACQLFINKYRINTSTCTRYALEEQRLSGRKRHTNKLLDTFGTYIYWFLKGIHSVNGLFPMPQMHEVLEPYVQLTNGSCQRYSKVQSKALAKHLLHVIKSKNYSRLQLNFPYGFNFDFCHFTTKKDATPMENALLILSNTTLSSILYDVIAMVISKHVILFLKFQSRV